MNIPATDGEVSRKVERRDFCNQKVFFFWSLILLLFNNKHRKWQYTKWKSYGSMQIKNVLLYWCPTEIESCAFTSLSQKHWIVGARMDLWKSLSPTPPFKTGCLQQVHRKASRQVWSISRKLDSTDSLGSLLQCSVTLTENSSLWHRAMEILCWAVSIEHSQAK